MDCFAAGASAVEGLTVLTQAAAPSPVSPDGLRPGGSRPDGRMLETILATLRLVASKAFELFEQSKQPLETRTTVTRTRTTRLGVEVTETVTVKRTERSGDVRPLQSLLQCVDRELKVLKSLEKSPADHGSPEDPGRESAAGPASASTTVERCSDGVIPAPEVEPVTHVVSDSQTEQPADVAPAGSAERPLASEPGFATPLSRSLAGVSMTAGSQAFLPPRSPTTRRGRLRESLARLAEGEARERIRSAR